MIRVQAPPSTVRDRIVRALREADRAAGKHDRTQRIRSLLTERDWGHRLMAVTGRDGSGGMWSPPRVRDIYFRRDDDGGLTVTRHAMEAWDRVQGKRGRREEWRSFDSQDDGFTIRVGYLGDDGRLHDSGIYGDVEIRLFRRWLMWDGWVKAEWCGLRRWAYYKGLHRAVDHRDRFTCGLIPGEGSGGYRHWHCDVRRPLWAIWTGRRTQHPGPHRYRAYTWDGPGERVKHDPTWDRR